jgi:biotin synthase-like enzyme
MDKELAGIIAEANKIFLENFLPETCFERAIFFSWHCRIRNCAYCYMSTQKEKPSGKPAVRSRESILAEVLISKKLGWEIGFFSGGIDAFSHDDFFDILKLVCAVAGEKIWLNIGPISKDLLKKYAPYTKGVVGSIETMNESVHEKVCPSKPTEPYEQMFEDALSMGMSTAMTIIIGLGETKRDFSRLSEFIERYKISKIHFYGLNPQKGTIFEKTSPPSKEYQGWWIAKTRIAFPKINIQAGIWEDRPEYVELLLKSGANSISKFPALKAFNSPSAQEIEKQAALAGRKFLGSLTKLSSVDWGSEVASLEIPANLKSRILEKLNLYLQKMI